MDPGPSAAAQPMPAPPVYPPPVPSALAEPETTAPAWVERPPKRPGQLSPGWRLAFGIGWAAIIIAYAAVWETSRIVGLSTWWLGADAEPRMLLIQLVPFYGPILVTFAAASNWRRLPYLGIGVAFIGAAIGVADLGRVEWIAAVELVLAGAALCISVASLAGMYRPLKAESEPAVPVPSAD